MLDYLIVGAGLFGATCARLLADAGKKVHLVERRSVIAGNCYDERIGDLLVNRYGGHIFHTNSKRVWDFLSRFTSWIPYEHRVKAKVGYTLYSFPVNRMTLQQVYGADLPQYPGLTPELYQMFYAGYSRKQWGGDPPRGVIERIPVRNTWDDRYYSDRYQAMPEHGYAAMIGNMLAGIEITLDTDYLGDLEYWDNKTGRVIYSGRIDELFGCDLGELPYRSLRWESEEQPNDYQGCATVNYCDEKIPYTRILEWQHYGHRGRYGKTIIAKEYAEAFRAGVNEPMYPIASDESAALYREYRKRIPENMFVGGRLGSYQYLNMDQTVAQAMHVCEGMG